MNIFDYCSIVAANVSSNGNISIAVVNDSLAEERSQHSIPLIHVGDNWSPVLLEPVLPWLVAGIGVGESAKNQAIFVGWGGQVLVVNDGCQREAIQRADADYVSIVRSVVSIDGEVYCVGMRRQVHRKMETRWVEMDGNTIYRGDENDVGFNAMHGFSSKELYAAGLNGEIWQCCDEQWLEVDTPTNVHLHSVCCASDGKVYIGGRCGILICGRHYSWEILNVGAEDTIWDIESFQDKLYMIIGSSVCVFVGGNLKIIDNPLTKDVSFFRLFASKSSESLWVFGSKKIVKYDGVSWLECTSELADDILESGIIDFFDNRVLVNGSVYLPEE